MVNVNAKMNLKTAKSMKKIVKHVYDASPAPDLEAEELNENGPQLLDLLSGKDKGQIAKSNSMSGIKMQLSNDLKNNLPKYISNSTKLNDYQLDELSKSFDNKRNSKQSLDSKDIS